MKRQMIRERKTALMTGAFFRMHGLILVLLCLAVFPRGGLAQAMHVGHHPAPTLGETFPTPAGESPGIGLGTAQMVAFNDGDRYELVARPGMGEISGKPVKLFAFNGTVPGPTLRVCQGSEIILRFRNLTDTPTTLHFHGARLDNRFDGTPGLTQTNVEVGGSFEYRVRFNAVKLNMSCRGMV